MSSVEPKHVARDLALKTLFDRGAFAERLIASIEDCVKVLDLGGRFVYMSPNGQRALGIANFGELVGTSWIDTWQGEARRSASDAVAAARAGRTARFTGYYPVGGDPRWFDVEVSAITGDDGRPFRLLAVSRDITKFVEAQEALRESEERHRAFSSALPGMTWTARADGRLDYLSDKYEHLRERSDQAALDDRWLDTLHPDDREPARRRWQQAIDSGELYDMQFRVQTPGGFRWQLARATPARDVNGAIARWIGVNIDIDDQHRADDARETFVALIENSDDFIGILDVDGKLAYVNAAGRRLLDIDSPEAALASSVESYYMPEDRAFAHEVIGPALERDGHWAGDFRLRNFATGKPVPVSHNVFKITGRDGKALGTATVSRDRRERERVEFGLRLLAETGRAALDSLDLRETLHNIAGAFVTEYASYCIIDVVEEGGMWSRTAVHRDPALSAVLSDMSQPSEQHPIAKALRGGVSSVVRIDDDWARVMPGDERRGNAVRALGVRSFITVPVVQDDGTIVGALTTALDTSSLRDDFTDDDLRFVQEVGRRTGSAIENARLYERERRIAVELQAASLPVRLPAAQGLLLHADYRPGSDEATIGGDWYDAFALEDGRVVITVGDVIGHGLRAAVTMTKLRQAMQAAAMIDADPNVMLRVADRTLRLLDNDAYATALAAIYDPCSGNLTFASAGHPGPVMRGADGRIEDFESPGLMLGLRSADASETTEFVAHPGSTVVFFTDGLVEATRDIDEGIERLRAALGDASLLDGDRPAHALVDRVLAGSAAQDDIAVLVARIGAAR